MSTLAMVTGANGHLGNNLVRQLRARGQPVRAGVRDPAGNAALHALGCEVVRAPLQDIDALRQSLHGVDVLYQVAAVFRHWAKNPQAEIVEVNVQGTRNVLRAAAEAGVRRVVYVSSVAAVGHDGRYRDESVWNDERQNPSTCRRFSPSAPPGRPRKPMVCRWSRYCPRRSSAPMPSA